MIYILIFVLFPIVCSQPPMEFIKYGMCVYLLERPECASVRNAVALQAKADKNETEVEEKKKQDDMKLLEASAVCMNDGFLINDTCICKKGFEGDKCENSDECLSQNGASRCMEYHVCVNNRSEILGYSCECPAGFEGEFCALPTADLYGAEKEIECKHRGCAKVAGDGICDRECNHFACKYDGGDCSGGGIPYANCTQAYFCSLRFKNGLCDHACNNEECLFDGFDCIEKEPEDSWSMRHRTDIPVTVMLRPELFVAKVDAFLSAMSKKLGTWARIRKTHGQMDVFEWSLEKGKGARVDFGARTDARTEYSTRARRQSTARDGQGVAVVVQVGLAACTNECLRDVKEVAHFIARPL